MDERIFHLYRRKELSDFLGGIHIRFFDPRRKIHFQWNEKVQEEGEHIWTRWQSNFGDCSAYSCNFTPFLSNTFRAPQVAGEHSSTTLARRLPQLFPLFPFVPYTEG